MSDEIIFVPTDAARLKMEEDVKLLQQFQQKMFASLGIPKEMLEGCVSNPPIPLSIRLFEHMGQRLEGRLGTI